MLKPITSDTLTAPPNLSGRPDLKPEQPLLHRDSYFPSNDQFWITPIPENQVIPFAWDRSFTLVEGM